MTHTPAPTRGEEQSAFALSAKEVAAILYVLDDEDLLVLRGNAAYADTVRRMWRRLHLALLAHHGDTDAAAMLEAARRDYPERL